MYGGVPPTLGGEDLFPAGGGVFHLLDDPSYIELRHDQGRAVPARSLSPPRETAKLSESSGNLPESRPRASFTALRVGRAGLPKQTTTTFGVVDEGRLDLVDLLPVGCDLPAETLGQLGTDLRHMGGTASLFIMELSVDQQPIALIEGRHAIEESVRAGLEGKVIFPRPGVLSFDRSQIRREYGPSRGYDR